MRSGDRTRSRAHPSVEPRPPPSASRLGLAQQRAGLVKRRRVSARAHPSMRVAGCSLRAHAPVVPERLDEGGKPRHRQEHHAPHLRPERYADGPDSRGSPSGSTQPPVLLGVPSFSPRPASSPADPTRASPRAHWTPLFSPQPATPLAPPPVGAVASSATRRPRARKPRQPARSPPAARAGSPATPYPRPVPAESRATRQPRSATSRGVRMPSRVSGTAENAAPPSTREPPPKARGCRNSRWLRRSDTTALTSSRFLHCNIPLTAPTADRSNSKCTTPRRRGSDEPGRRWPGRAHTRVCRRTGTEAHACAANDCLPC